MPESTHLTDDQLVAALDGELSPANVALVDEHIAACWTCRTRRDALATAMTDFVQARDTVLFPRIPPPTAWPGLEPQLAPLQAQPTPVRHWWPRASALMGTRVSPLTNWRAALTAAAMFAIVIAAVQSLYERPLAAAEVLARTRPVERLDGRRQLNMEERDASSGRVLGRRRIEIWQNDAGRVTARRLFDEQGHIVAGEWTRADGTRTVVERGQAPRVESAASQVPVTSSNVWRLAPGAVTFAGVTSAGSGAPAPGLSEHDDNYALSAPLADIADATIVLTVRKADMHPIAHTLRLGTTIVFAVETAFDETPAASMPAFLFEPDRELVDVRVADAGIPRARSDIRRPALTGRDTLELEVDALLQLDRAGALLQEQVTINRSVQGVTIEARTETAARRDELRAALSRLAERPGARVDVRTFNDTEPDARTGTPASVKIVEFTSTRAPVYDDLRTYFLGQAASTEVNDVEEQIQRMTRAVLDRSLRARLHARAIVQLTSRVSQTDLQTLDDSRVNGWWMALGEHARGLEQDTGALRVDLEPVFFASMATSSASVEPAPITDVWEAAPGLLELAAAHDADLSQAFARSVEAPQQPLAVRGPRFRESLIAAEALASGLRAAASSRR